MTPQWISRRLTPLLETLALGALLASSEPGIPEFLGILDRHQHPALLAARVVPLVHLLLWSLSRRHPRLIARLGLATIELVLACALSAEFYLPLAAILFFSGASVAVSCHFLGRELPARSEKLTRGYLGYTSALSAAVVVLGLLIFPLLPRTRTPIGSGFGTGAAGYTENVQVSSWTTVRTRGFGASASVLRLFTQSPEAQDLKSSIYLGLLRGRVLDRFDGRSWSAFPKTPRREAPDARESSEAPHGTVAVQVVREAVGSEILPLPYGTVHVHAGPQESRRFLNSPDNGEWTEPGSDLSRSRYEIELRPFDLGSIQRSKALGPPAHTLELPEEIRNGYLAQESRRIFARARTPREKIAALLKYFSGFEAVTDEESDAESTSVRRQLRKARFTALEEFLLIRKRGHCEWFASAAAILLRMNGIPSRLVSGFRVSRDSGPDVVILRNSDAHSWIEAWTADRGWFPVDPTPRVLLKPGAWDRLVSGYEILSAYWYRYGVTYDRPSPLQLRAWEFPKERWEGMKSELKRGLLGNPARTRRVIGLAAALSLIVLLLFRLKPDWAAFFLPGGRRDPDAIELDWRASRRARALERERRRLEKLLGVPARSEVLETLAEKMKSARALRSADALTAWQLAYERARFGPVPLEEAETEKTRQYLRSRTREIATALGEADRPERRGF